MSAFFFKELSESFRTFRGLLLGIVFMIMGMMAPLMAHLTPQLMDMVGKQQGIRITLPEPVWQDAWIQYFKNMGQMGLILLVIVMMHNVVEERTRGTAGLMLSHMRGRRSFIAAKLLAQWLVFWSMYLLSAGLCFLYTSFLFMGQQPEKLWLPVLSFGIYATLVMTALFLSGVLARSVTVTAITGGGILLLFSLISAIPELGDISPGQLASGASGLVAGGVVPEDMLGPGVATLLLMGICLWLTDRIWAEAELN